MTLARTPATVPNGLESPPGRHAWAALSVVLVASFMAAFDLFVVNIAVPVLRSDLRVGDGALELIVSGYAFTYAAGLVTGGRLGDRFGYRRMFILGMASFTGASLLCALAVTPVQLVAARLLQGLAASLMVPQVLSVITVTFPAGHRGRATAWMGAVTGLGALAGQILGGLLLQVDLLGLGWRSIFLVNVPIGLTAVFLARRVVPASRAGRQATFDPVGALLLSLTLALVLLPLALGPQANWPAWAWASLATAVAAGFLAMRWQRAVRRRGAEPIIDPRLFRNRPYTLLLGAVSLFQLYFGSFMFALTLLLQVRLGSTPGQAALVFTLQGLLFTVASMAGGRLVVRYGLSVPFAGGCLQIAGLLFMAGELVLKGAHLTAAGLVPPLALIGLGNGLLFPPMIGVALSRVGPEQAGAASGTLNTSQQFANSLGVALIGTLFLALAGHNLGSATTAMAIVDAVYTGCTVTMLALMKLASRPERAIPRG